jgi:hypothetical protein
MIRIYTTFKKHNGTQTVIDHDSYVATKPEDCRDSVDRMAFDLALEMGQTVTLGCVTAEPV